MTPSYLSHRARRRALAAVLAAALGLAPLTAAAQSDDKALAEALFREGRTLMKAGKAEEACPKFAESQRLDPSIGTLLNLALCHERTGKTASAWAEYKEVALEAKRDGQVQRAYFAKLRAGQLEKKLSRVRIELAEPVDGVVVSIGDRELSEAAIATALPLDPGQHRIEVVAPGYEPRETTVELPADGKEMVVAIPPLVPLPPEPEPVEEPPPAEEVLEPELSPLFWGGASLAAMGLTVGVVAGAFSLVEAGEFRDACPDEPCDPATAPTRDDALVMANVSNVGFIVAGVGAVLGAIGFVMSDRDAEGDARHPAVPRVAANGLVWTLP